MRKRIVVAAVGAAILGAPVAAMGSVDAVPLKQYETKYLALHAKVADQLGQQTAGRDIVSDGYVTNDGVREPTRSEVLDSIQGMKAALQPEQTAPAPAPTTGSSTTTAAPASSTVACESGGDYSADTGNGFYGGYQFDQGTWDAYAPAGYAGTNPAAAPPSVQDATAATVPYDAWPNC